MSIPDFDHPFVVHWFRRDLRLKDNRALHGALTSGHPVLPLFVFDKHILDKLEAEDDSRVTFLHDRICEMQREVQAMGSSMLVIHGDPLSVVEHLATSGNLLGVHTNEDYEPYALERDASVRETLTQRGIEWHPSTWRSHQARRHAIHRLHSLQQALASQSDRRQHGARTIRSTLEPLVAMDV
jgi:deoxyribodipyrimidine photolyase